MENNQFTADKLMALLRLTRQPVGVKLADTQEEYESLEAQELKAPLEYCVSVRCAGLGHSIKFKKETSRCSGSTRALGLEEPSREFYNGKEGCELGLFADPKVAENTNRQVKMITQQPYGVVVKPLQKWEAAPDVVIVVAKAREMMRLAQGYTCTYGLQPHIRLSGNQALCIECTATPILTGAMNLSLMCSGTRFLAEWGDDEVGMGIPYDKFEGTVQGVWNTVNGTESDARKREIKEALERLGCDCTGMTFGTAYYLSERPNKKY